MIALSIVLALVPGDDVENPLNFYHTVFISLFINLAAGVAIYWHAKRKRIPQTV